MAFFPSDSAIKMTPELSKAVSEAPSITEIQRLMHQAAIDQHLIEKDPFDTDGKDYFSYRPVEAGSAAAATKVARTVTLNGVKHVLEAPVAEGEAGLDRAEAQLFRQIFAGNNTTETRRDAAGRFVAQPTTEEVATEVVDPAAAMQAAATKAALAAQGIDVDELRAFTESKKAERYTESWATAAVTFGEQHPEFPRGKENQEILAQIIADNDGLLDAEDKTAAMEAAHKHALKNGLYVEPAEDAEARELAAANSPAELQEVLRRRGRIAPLNSGMWGR